MVKFVNLMAAVPVDLVRSLSMVNVKSSVPTVRCVNLTVAALAPTALRLSLANARTSALLVKFDN